MTWLIWRQHRLQALVAALSLAVFGAILATKRAELLDFLASCTARGCAPSEPDSLLPYLLIRATIFAPLVVGLFWGTTIIGRELESGTAGLAWSQSITRRRWITTKLATLFIVATAVGGALGAIVRWYLSTTPDLRATRFGPVVFSLSGIVPMAYTVFAAALGLLASVVWRRVLPAMAVTIAGYAVIWGSVVLLLRPRYAEPLTTGAYETPAGAWELGWTMEGVARYHPADRFWPFQYIESGIFVGLAAILTVAAVVVVRRRDV
jgi:hypothetical protein